MKHGKILSLLMTVVFGLIAVAISFLEPEPQMNTEVNIPLSAVLEREGRQEEITCWADDRGAYYLFLPSYARMDSAYLRCHDPDVRIDGRLVEDGMSCGELSLGVPYSLTFASSEGQITTVLTLMQSRNLPAIYVDTISGNMELIHEAKGNQEQGRMRLYTPDGQLRYIGNLDAVNGRGNDWAIPKKSYSLELTNGADLLGMGKAKKWILQANAFDASHLRNKLVYDFAGEVGLTYSPESQWADLYLNGEYAGLYLLCERNELQEQRVALQGDGQYLVSMDTQWRLEQNSRPFVTTDSGYAFRIHGSQISNKMLQEKLQSVENAISAEDGTDPITGMHWTELVDLDSWVLKYLVEEIFGNGDAGAISQYFYGTAADTRMYAGPVWDFDISMGNSVGKRGGEPRSIFAGRSRVRSNISLSWYYELSQHEIFRERLIQLYRETCLPLLDTFLNIQLDTYIDQILDAAAMNQLRWESLAASQVSALAETENIRNFMMERVRFLSELWLEQGAFYNVLVDTNDGHGTIAFAVRPGEQIPYLPNYEASPEILGWYASGDAEPFDVRQPIYEDMEIVLMRQVPESAEAEQTTDDDTRKMSVKYMPFVLMTGILVILYLLDRGYCKQKQGAAS